MKPALLVKLLLLSVLLLACTGYKSQYVAFKPPEAYPNQQRVAGIAIAGEAYVETASARDAFGFDIRGAGLLPVQLVMENQGGKTLSIVTSQTFLVDNQGQYWQVIPNPVVVDRIENATELAGFFGSGAGRGATIGAVGGAILGAALGIVSGHNVGEALGKGAVLGAAGGAVIGGARQGTDYSRRAEIGHDIRTKGLEDKDIPPEHLANGFLFFPGEASSARELRLQLLERETGLTRTIRLPLQ